ncbi:MAG: ATP-binding protein [Elusimicrobiota bacterium]|nr:MAG: ATP-binding protein [Elusimicrobiota bacterium]
MRQHHPKTAVVMTTAAGNEQVAVAAMKKGAMDYITQKDLRQTDLGQLLRRVIEIRDLVNQNMELRQVNQMKNEFIANVSHELRTPLTVVIGYANTMRDGSMGPLNDAQQKALGSMIDRAEGLMATLNNILRIREVHEGRKQMLLKPIELGKLVAAQVEKAGRELRRRKLKLSVEPLTSEVWVMADEEKLGDVIDNLLSNAVKFSPVEGALKVSLSLEKTKVKLSVVDAGPGVAPELLPHVFDTFSAANQGPTREYPGLGLGLPSPSRSSRRSAAASGSRARAPAAARRPASSSRSPRRTPRPPSSTAPRPCARSACSSSRTTPTSSRSSCCSSPASRETSSSRRPTPASRRSKRSRRTCRASSSSTS